VEDRLGAEGMHGFAQTPDGAIWLSGELGIGRYDGTWRYWTTQQGLRRNDVFVTAAAPDGTVFFADRNHGLGFVRGDTIDYLDSGDGLINDQI